MKIPYATTLTRNYDKFQRSREPIVDLTNRKPYRTSWQKEEARKHAYKGKDGTFHSSAGVSYHPTVKA